jgi:hypothetical protein
MEHRATSEFWEHYHAVPHRALAVKRPYGFLWFWIGDHEAYERLIT